MTALTYAQLRAQRMQAHDEALAEIQPDLPPPKPEKKPAKTTPKKRKAPGPPPEPRMGTRRSGRVVMNQRSAEEKQAAEEEEERIYQEERDRERREKHGSRSVAALSGVTGASDTDSLISMFNDVLVDFARSYEPVEEKPKTKKRGATPASSPAKEKAAAKADVELLQSKVEELEHRATVKVNPERAYSMVFHPHALKDLIFVGDKNGHVGLWDATDAGQEGEDGEEDQGVFWHWKNHTRTVSMLRFAPNDKMHLYSSSYDCTLRRLNFEKGIHEEVLDADQWDEFGQLDNLIHSFDFDSTGNNLWAVDNSGGIIHRDLREPMDTARRWQVDKKKIGGISVNPSNGLVGVTAHLKQDMRIWDLGKLMDLPEDAEPELLEDCTVTKFEHVHACSSSYFDRTGTRILTTSYDDTLRVFDIDPWQLGKIHNKPIQPSTAISHDCQVGRYVTVFKAQWSLCPTLPSHLHVGNMRRTLDLYAPGPTMKGTSLGRLTDEVITAVPAVTAAHPIRECRYAGANASGKVSFYAPPR